MSAQPAEKQNRYDVIYSSELPYYMSLDDMHERLTANIRKAYAIVCCSMI